MTDTLPLELLTTMLWMALACGFVSLLVLAVANWVRGMFWLRVTGVLTGGAGAVLLWITSSAIVNGTAVNAQGEVFTNGMVGGWLQIGTIVLGLLGAIHLILMFYRGAPDE